LCQYLNYFWKRANIAICYAFWRIKKEFRLFSISFVTCSSHLSRCWLPSLQLNLCYQEKLYHHDHQKS
jgi:hypothetical protein